MTFLNCDPIHGPVEEECKVIIIQIKISTVDYDKLELGQSSLISIKH